MVKRINSSKNEKDTKVIEAIHDIFEKYEDEGAVFVLAVFMNGLVNAIGMYSANADIANTTMGNVLETLSTSVEDLETLGVFNRSNHLQ